MGHQKTYSPGRSVRVIVATPFASNRFVSRSIPGPLIEREWIFFP